MPCHLIALGDTGARMLQSALYALCAGVTPDLPLTVTMMCAGQEAASGAFDAWKDYETVAAHVGGAAGCFSRRAALRAWPEEGQTAFSLNDQAASPLDQLLSRALFTREQASLSPARAMDAGYDVAAMAWAGMLSAEPTGALAALQADLAQDDTRVVLLGSLCDTVCAAGVQALCTWMESHGGRKPFASLLLPVYKGEESALCERILRTAQLEERLSGLCLAGLPEDCRPVERGSAQLCDWLAVYAACCQLKGMEGAHVWRIPVDHIDWAMFGEDADVWRRGSETLMQTAYLLAACYGDQLEAGIAAHSRLRDRMTPWYNAHFSPVRRMSDDQREALLQDLRALKRLLGGYAAWMRDMQRNLPPVMRWIDALTDARKEAEAHYEQVLNTVGQYTVLASEIQRSGMAEESVVHRHDMSDTEAEAAIKQRDALLDRLTELISEQDELNHRLGGRVSRSMLNAVAAECAREAETQREIVRQAAAIIAHAADIATQEEMSKVATSRVRLARKERLVEMLDGRTARARHDAERWSSRSLRSLPPVLPDDAEETNAPALFDEAWLQPMVAWYAGEEGKAAKQLAEKWPWAEKELRALNEAIARNEFPDADLDCLGNFLACIVRCLTA